MTKAAAKKWICGDVKGQGKALFLFHIEII